MILVNTPNRDLKEWVLESGCTFHMCTIKNWLTELVDLNGGQVLMGNEVSRQIKGIGNLSLLLENYYIVELDKVRYAIELKRNLFSLGKLDEDYDTRIHKSFIKSRLDHKKVTSSPKINEIYSLQAEPLVGYSFVAVNSYSDKSLI